MHAQQHRAAIIFINIPDPDLLLIVSHKFNWGLYLVIVLYVVDSAKHGPRVGVYTYDYPWTIEKTLNIMSPFKLLLFILWIFFNNNYF